MNPRNSFLFETYFKLFNFIAKERIAAKDLDHGIIHTHLLTVITTGILMWGYATVAFIFISNPVPGIVGYICSFIHFFSPLLFKINNCKYKTSGILLAAGIIHQATFSFYTGGFTSDIIIWFGIIPMLAGLIAGRYAVVFWSIVALSITTTYLFLELNSNFTFPNLITPQGELIAHSMIAFGWIFLSLILVYFYILIKDMTLEKLQDSSDKINTLLRVLCHDLANLLQVILSYASSYEKLTPERKEKAISKIYSSSMGMNDVIQNVKQLYYIDSIKDELDLRSVSLSGALNYAYMILEDKINDKNIKIKKEIDEDISVLAEETSFKHQVLLNILSNAIKFSHDDSEIIISATQTEDNKVKVEFQDFGVGMPNQVIEGLFNPAVIASRRGTNGEKGTGFGMSIMNNFVERYGGRVEVESNEGEGTKFIIHFSKP